VKASWGSLSEGVPEESTILCASRILQSYCDYHRIATRVSIQEGAREPAVLEIAATPCRVAGPAAAATAERTPRHILVANLPLFLYAHNHKDIQFTLKNILNEKKKMDGRDSPIMRYSSSASKNPPICACMSVLLIVWPCTAFMNSPSLLSR